MIQFTVKHAIADVWQVVIEHPDGVGGYRTKVQVVSTHRGRDTADHECARRNTEWADFAVEGVCG